VIYNGDCLEVLAGLPENSVDTCITDPPYGLGFMGKQWDTFDKSQFGIAGNEGENDLKVKKSFNVLPRYRKDGLQEFTYKWASEVYRVLKPGAIMLAFGGTRTYHRMVCAIEDAGFEIRDTIAWVYGSGFPKSYDISKGIEAQMKTGRSSPKGQRMVAMGDEYEQTPLAGTPNYGVTGNFTNKDTGSKPMAITTPEAQLWDGWGTALKPAFEPIVVAMKPVDGNFVNNALTWGVAGYWIDGGRVGTSKNVPASPSDKGTLQCKGLGGGWDRSGMNPNIGRFPANFIHDGSDEVVGLFPECKQANDVSEFKQLESMRFSAGGQGVKPQKQTNGKIITASAARFFYCAKASRSERNAGLEGMPIKQTVGGGGMNNTPDDVCGKYGSIKAPAQNHHPTVKPIELMRYLVRLTKTPTGGIVLDPFMGSGTTGIACELEGRDFIGIEREAEYVEITEKRIAHYALPIMELVE